MPGANFRFFNLSMQPNLSTVRLLLAGLVAWCALSASAFAQEGLRAPFGFFWGDDIQNVRATLDGAKCKITKEEDVADRKAWTVEGLIRPGMKQAVFYFKKDALVEIELQYQDASWPDERYDRLVERNRDFFTKILGAPKEVNESIKLEDGVEQEIRGYEWGEFDTQLVLLNYVARRDESKFRSVSVHYRYAFAEDLDNAGTDLLMENLDDPLPITGEGGAMLPGEDALPVEAAPSPAPDAASMPSGAVDAVGPIPTPTPTPQDLPMPTDPGASPEMTPTPESTPVPETTPTPAPVVE